MNLLVSETSKLSFSPIPPLISACVPPAFLLLTSHQVVVQLLVEVLATLSSLLVTVSAYRLPAQVTVKDVPSHQQHAQAVRLDGSLLVHLAIQPVTILSPQKY